jgi:hypothetical protein
MQAGAAKGRYFLDTNDLRTLRCVTLVGPHKLYNISDLLAKAILKYTKEGYEAKVAARKAKFEKKKKIEEDAAEAAQKLGVGGIIVSLPKMFHLTQNQSAR